MCLLHGSRLGSAFVGRGSVIAAAIPAHDLHFWMGAEPGSHRFSCSIWEHFNRLTTLSIDEDGAVGCPFFPTPIIEA
jgi:hypothetical protein